MEHGGHCSDRELVDYIIKFEFLKRGILPSQLGTMSKKDMDVYVDMFMKENEIKAKSMETD